LSSFDIFSFKILIEDFYYYHGTLSQTEACPCKLKFSKMLLLRSVN